MAAQAPAVLIGRGIGRVFGAGELAVRALHPTDLEIPDLLTYACPEMSASGA